MDCRMDGRVALITGSSRGLGRAMAMVFAASGASVAITARRADVLEATRKEVAAAGGGNKVCAVAARFRVMTCSEVPWKRFGWVSMSASCFSALRLRKQSARSAAQLHILSTIAGLPAA